MTQDSDSNFSSISIARVNWEQELKKWVNDHLSILGLGVETSQIAWTAIAGDAGFRKYFRVGVIRAEMEHSFIAVYSPPESEPNRAFLEKARYFLQHGVHVPKVMAENLSEGFFLLEDLGQACLLDHLDDNSVHALYGEALMTLLRIQQCPPDCQVFPDYTEELLRRELMLFPHWFIEGNLGLSLSPEENQCLSIFFDQLIHSATEQPQIIVHRDFHSRNICISEIGNIGVIDFQDAVLGPITYDLVSLLRDCYISWPYEQVQNWALAYASMALETELLNNQDEAKFLRWFDLMGLQRHIKVLGIFCRLERRDGKAQYLSSLPMVVNYVRSILVRYDEFKNVYEWFEGTLMPKIEVQSWWSSTK